MNKNLKSCGNKYKKEYVAAQTGHRNVAHVRPHLAYDRS